MTTTGSHVVPILIREIVSLDEEIGRVSKPLTKRRDEARKLLKDAMTEANMAEAIDEESGYRALIRHTTSEAYVPEKLLPLLSKEQGEKVIDTTVYVNADAMKELINAGELTRSRLEQEGALVRKLRARQLIIEPLKGARP